MHVCILFLVQPFKCGCALTLCRCLVSWGMREGYGQGDGHVVKRRLVLARQCRFARQCFMRCHCEGVIGTWLPIALKTRARWCEEIVDSAPAIAKTISERAMLIPGQAAIEDNHLRFVSELQQSMPPRVAHLVHVPTRAPGLDVMHSLPVLYHGVWQMHTRLGQVHPVLHVALKVITCARVEIPADNNLTFPAVCDAVVQLHVPHVTCLIAHGLSDMPYIRQENVTILVGEVAADDVQGLVVWEVDTYGRDAFMRIRLCVVSVVCQVVANIACHSPGHTPCRLRWPGYVGDACESWYGCSLCAWP